MIEPPWVKLHALFRVAERIGNVLKRKVGLLQPLGKCRILRRKRIDGPHLLFCLAHKRKRPAVATKRFSACGKSGLDALRVCKKRAFREKLFFLTLFELCCGDFTNLVAENVHFTLALILRREARKHGFLYGLEVCICFQKLFLYGCDLRRAERVEETDVKRRI